ncbi:MAG TPA: hypothetical protein VLG11_02960 [Candidatus Saccharimonadales bacterium]|nr:hypothetical protein [Candidatus Saccharimonadales bacterium]
MTKNSEEYRPPGANTYDPADMIVPIGNADLFSSGIRRKVKERHSTRFHESAQRIESGLQGIHIPHRAVLFPAITHVTKYEFAACVESPQERLKVMDDIYYGQNGRNRVLSALHHMSLRCAGIVVTPPSAIGNVPCRFMVALAATGLRQIRKQHEEIRRRVYGGAEAPDMPIGITLVEAAMSENQFYERQAALQAIATSAEPVPQPLVAKFQGIEYKP